MHTWCFPGGDDDLVMSRSTSEDFSASAREQLDALLADVCREFPDVPVEVDVRHACAAEALVKSSEGAALLVIGRFDQRVPRGSHLGPVTRAVLREASCPVLLAALDQHHAPRVRTTDVGVAQPV